MPPTEFWEKHVHSKEDVVTFYKKYYPELPDVAVEALARRISSAVKGETELSDQWLKAKAQMSIAQELKLEIEEQKQIGLRNLQEKRTKIQEEEFDEEQIKENINPYEKHVISVTEEDYFEKVDQEPV